MNWLPSNWRTTLGGVLLAAGSGLIGAGYPTTGMVLQAVGSLLLGNNASDKQVAHEAIADVKQDVNIVKQDVRNVKQVVNDSTASGSVRPFMSRQ